MSYRYIDDIAIADSAFEAESKTLGELFIDSADAVVNIMVENPESIVLSERKEVSLKEDDPEVLLFRFLNEIIYFKDAQNLIMRAEKVNIDHISEPADVYELKATLAGEPIDQSKHAVHTDVKAVTLHRLKIEEIPGGWRAIVVVDI